MKNRKLRAALVVSGLGALIGLAGAPVLGQEDPPGGGPSDPPGNNGTIKIDGQDFDDHPDNEPHVGCIFQVDFFGYDEGELYADVLFEGIAPTGGGQLLTDRVFIGEDPAGGGTDLDASETYNLSEALADVEPHPQQGYHVRLTVNADGSQGADVKHKVFWVEACDLPPPVTTTTSTTTSTTTTTAPGPTTTSTTSTSVPGPTTSTTTPGTTTTTTPPRTAPEQPTAPGPDEIAPPATEVLGAPSFTG